MKASLQPIPFALQDKSFRHVISPYALASLFFAVTYGLILASFPIDVFKDRENYLFYANSSLLIQSRYLAEGTFSFLTNEPVWLLLNTVLSIWLTPEAVVRLFIFMPAVTVAYIMLRNDSRSFFWLLLLLVMPIVIKNHIIHLRQGLAIAVFLVGWQMSGRGWRYLLFALAPLIHSSFFFILILVFITYFTRKNRFAASFWPLLYCFAGIVAGKILGGVAQLVGARQGVEYQFSSVDVSGLGFIFWFCVLMIFFIKRHSLLHQDTFAVGALIFYLSMYFFNETAGRIFESIVIVILLAGLRLSAWRRKAFLVAILGYCLLTWFIRMNQPWLGFA